VNRNFKRPFRSPSRPSTQYTSSSGSAFAAAGRLLIRDCRDLNQEAYYGVLLPLVVYAPLWVRAIGQQCPTVTPGVHLLRGLDGDKMLGPLKKFLLPRRWAAGRLLFKAVTFPLTRLGVAACEQERVGLQTSMCVGQRSVRIR
jgi:hypothetical protein